MPSYALHRLRDLRLAGERQAERTLAEASAALRGATEEKQRLETEVEAARTAEAAARAAEPPAPTVGAAQVARRYWSRLEAERRARFDALELHGARVLEPAARAEAEARAAYQRARQRREVIEKAIARREAEGRLVRERRAEAAADDLAPRRRT